MLRIMHRRIARLFGCVTRAELEEFQAGFAQGYSEGFLEGQLDQMMLGDPE